MFTAPFYDFHHGLERYEPENPKFYGEDGVVHSFGQNETKGRPRIRTNFRAERGPKKRSQVITSVAMGLVSRYNEQTLSV